jgi:hypothetical protein
VSLQLDENVGNKVWDVVGVCADESAETKDPAVTRVQLAAVRANVLALKLPAAAALLLPA